MLEFEFDNWTELNIKKLDLENRDTLELRVLILNFLSTGKCPRLTGQSCNKVIK